MPRASTLLIYGLTIFSLGVCGADSPANDSTTPLPVDELVFAVRPLGPDSHWYANFGYYADSKIEPPDSPATEDNGARVAYVEGASLRRLSLTTGKATVLLEDLEGGIRDPVVHYDGRRIVFSYRPGGEANYHLYEIQSDGSGLRQLTAGPYDDIEPTFLPDGDIIFVSSRCRRWVNCWVTQVAVLHRCDANGDNIRAISANLEHDNTPWVLPDGRVLYQRWEYVDRSQVDFHHLWTTNPDGTGQMVYFGNQRPGTVMIDAKPVPRTNKVVAIFSPGHGRKEHDGALAVVDTSLGPDEEATTKIVAEDPVYRDPWAFSEAQFLAAREHQLVAVDGSGKVQVVYQLNKSEREQGWQCHEPRPLMRRERERVIPSRVQLDQQAGYLTLSDVYRGRNMEGVERGDIKKLLVLECLPKPINYTGGMDPLTYGGSFTLERVLGTVPVEEDGSAYMELPAMRALFFVALDEQDMAVKRMQSFLTVQPGETTGCVGCHEQRTQTVIRNSNLQALKRPPSRIEPIDDCPDVLDFPRDIQPILDRNCNGCHGYEQTEQGGPYAGGVLLAGDRGPMFSHAYFTMTVKRLFTDGRNLPRGNYPPRTIGSSASRILKMLDGSHYGVRATEHEKKLLRLWTEVGAPYPGTYAALGNGAIGGYQQNQQINVDDQWPTTRNGAEIIERRCAGCHQKDSILPRSMSDERGLSFWRFSLDDPRLTLSRHIVFNLTRPQKSLLLLAPLSSEHGGYQLCKQPDGQTANVLASTDDADYRGLLAMIQAGKQNLDEQKRFDMPGFQPPAAYVREMRRYGILPQTTGPGGRLDGYQLDQAYWESLWYRQPRLDR